MDRALVFALGRSRFDFADGTPEFLATAQRYLKRVLYCNRTPFGADFLMELVFDYGEHAPFPTTATAVPSPDDSPPWTVREDPFSTYRAGFEVRTYRLCRRVLMFHHFSGSPLLVKSTDFEYEPGPAFTYLVGVTQAGYLNDATTGNVWERRVLPTLRLDYRRPVVNDTFNVLPIESLDGLEGGVDGAQKQWVDLDGEGIPGVLIDANAAWYYKSNGGSGKLATPRVLSTMPAPAELGTGMQQLEDLAGDGQLDLVAYGEPLQGYFKRTPEGGFETLRNFRDLPNIDFHDPNLRFIDVDGDGLPDILITEDHAFLWYRSRGKEGFDPLKRLVAPKDDDEGPAVVFADPEETIQLADMSGDGLVDIVRIRNGEVSYWPNLGYGRFGKKISLEGSPRFAAPDQFDARRIRFADVDGSGTSDLFYLGGSGTTLYFNESGNRLSAGITIRSLPPADSATYLSVTDLLGTGTATLVWSSPLPGARSIFYVDLMGSKKPHLLEKVTNNLGAETQLTYAPSTKFYLEDKAAGIPWLTRLPFPVHVVERLERFDQVSESRLVSTYRYRHGFFDGVEREFRGFARVEQRDAEEFTVSEETELFQAPVRTVTWFHTGAWLEKERLENALAVEYFPRGEKDPADLALLVKDTHFDADTLGVPFTTQDEREAARTLRGSMLRQEIYADDADITGDEQKALRPYVATEQNFAVRRLQSSRHGKHGVFYTFPRESLAVHTERNPDDPRVVHDLTLDVDEFGNVKRKATIAYARAPSLDTIAPQQTTVLATLTEAEFINRTSPETSGNVPEADRWHRVGVEFERRVWELTALPPFTLPGQRIQQFETLDQAIDNLILNPTANNTVPFDGTPSGQGPHRRLLDRKQQVFYQNDLGGALALGQLESLALPFETYELALTTGQVGYLANQSSLLTGVALSPTALAAILTSTTEGGYVQRPSDPNYWTVSGRLVFDATRFYLPVQAIDPFGNQSFVTYDTFSLLVTTTRDSLQNLVQATNDYRVLAPSEVLDPNLNRVALRFDALGMVERTAVMGKGTEGDTLDNPTTRLEYDLLRFQTSEEPVFVRTFAREEHFAVNPTSRIQESFTYSDGFGRVAMQKIQAEPGEVPGMTGIIDPRWVGTGRTVFNNKGNPVKQYEPFFSATSDFEDEAAIVETGVTPIIHYDPLDRVIRTELPNGTESRVDFDAWSQVTHDPNDTVIGSDWYAARGSPDPGGTEPGDPEARAAFLAAQHDGTPTTVHLDTLGRPFLSVAHNRTNGIDAEYRTRSTLDIEGNVLSILDARQALEATPTFTITQRFDVLARRLEVVSADAGSRLMVADVAGKPLRAWDARQQTHRFVYDELQRPQKVYVRQATADERLLLRTVYGESLDLGVAPPTTAPPSSTQQANLRGKPFHLYDCAGLMVNVRFDFKSNLARAERRLTIDFQTEPDWSDTDDVPGPNPSPAALLAAVDDLLEPEVFDTETTFDALNRVTTHKTHDDSVILPEYNQASLLEVLRVQVRGATAQRVIGNINYNARGQRTLCQYINPETDDPSVAITYDYDPQTFRLTRLHTTKGGTNLQDLLYTYDPVGNIVELRNAADNDPFFTTTPVHGNSKYRYDAVYRLIFASGREHPGTEPVAIDPPAGETLPHPNDSQALRLYTEEYVYDEVGNIKQLAHRPVVVGGSNNWTRNYTYFATNNRLDKTSVPGSPLDLTDAYTYDAHGSITSMPSLAVMEWDYADRLKHTRPVNGANPQDTFYTYDGAGQRVRKVFTHMGTLKERIYLGGYEIYRERPNTTGSTATLERQTLHVMDDQRRVAMVETKTIDTSPGATDIGVSRWRFQLDNHLGSATIELDQAGDVISYEEYHPYGSTAFHAADSATKRYRYTGKERDVETGLYYHGARYYAPWLGRWTAADPAGMVDGLNLYRYSRGNPIRFSDPGGTQSTGHSVDQQVTQRTDPELIRHLRGLTTEERTKFVNDATPGRVQDRVRAALRAGKLGTLIEIPEVTIEGRPPEREHKEGAQIHAVSEEEVKQQELDRFLSLDLPPEEVADPRAPTVTLFYTFAYGVKKDIKELFRGTEKKDFLGEGGSVRTVEVPPDPQEKIRILGEVGLLLAPELLPSKGLAAGGKSALRPTFLNRLDLQSGKLVGTLAQSEGRFTIAGSTEVVPKGTYDFVVQGGELRVGRGHTFLSGGDPVEYAGTITFDEGGRLLEWTNVSGHYRPSRAFAGNAGLPSEAFRAVTPPAAAGPPELPVFRLPWVP